ncbi:MAG: UDP-N-acetylglucosamine--N-acetylmuramyl-(pentapeptide) pyrophosphoryl-undecaprenol N-acetylglucosamine transferase [Patescibacteria group bacterium]
MFTTIDYKEPESPEDKKKNAAEKKVEQNILRILFAGGGSGGHINPILAVSEALREMMPQLKMNLILRHLGPQDSHTEVLKAANIETTFLLGAKWRRYASLKNILDIPLFFVSILQAFIKLLLFMPDVIFSKGGPGSLPVVLVGWFYRIPIIIHESDSVPGVSNAISARFATRIAVSFERAKNYFPPKKTALTGTPINPILLAGPLAQKTAKEVMGFDPNEPVILIIGGSQGAQSINEFIVTNLEDITNITQVIHQTGTANFSEIQRLSRAAMIEISTKDALPKRYHAVPYLKSEDMKNALSAADLVVSRSGSGSLFEIAAFKKPAILIPLQNSGRDHQRLNAYEFAKSGGAVIIEQSNLMSGIFMNQIKEILENPAVKETMSQGSGSFFIPNAAQIVAQEILKIAHK